MRRIIVLLVSCVFACPWLMHGADSCRDQKELVDSLSLKVKADQAAIRRLSSMNVAAELEKWAELSEQEKGRIVEDTMRTIASSLLDIALAAPGRLEQVGLKEMNIAGVRLPNGIGSLGTGQANSIIGRLQRSGAGDTARGKALIAAIRQLSTISGK